jgi:hypothetical protein
MTYDQIQTAHCERTRKHLMALIEKATAALEVIGSDPCSDLLLDMSHDLFVASACNRRIVTNTYPDTDVEKD